MMSASSRQVHSSTPPSRSASAPGPTYGAVMEETMERIQAAYFGAETSFVWRSASCHVTQGHVTQGHDRQRACPSRVRLQVSVGG